MFFFFQAEDGIRDVAVTGVQTCALPICDTRSPLYISIASQIVVPLGLCALLQATRPLRPADIWTAILLGHMTRCALSVLRFRQGKWRGIRVEMEPARS